jgi:predicted RNase H-like nuclease
MRLATPQKDTIIFGFDSAWTDALRAPGAICAITFSKDGEAGFFPPRLVSFAQALDVIRTERRGYAFRLTTLDQPTVVPNVSGMRPVERVAASVVSFIGGGVQPANRSKRGMFCDASPIWRFREALDAVEDPQRARAATTGSFLMEVFPALALAGLHSPFTGRMAAPKYNPANRRRFRLADWQAVAGVVEGVAAELGLPGLAQWAGEMAKCAGPRKADQDRLDAAICALVGLIWKGCERSASAMIGDLESGYMITPVSEHTRDRLQMAAEAKGVACN